MSDWETFFKILQLAKLLYQWGKNKYTPLRGFEGFENTIKSAFLNARMVLNWANTAFFQSYVSLGKVILIKSLRSVKLVIYKI